MATEKRLKGYDPITFESFTSHMTKHREPYDQYDMGYVDAFEQIENWLEYNTVDAVPVDKIIFHHILIDENGIPEVKLQLGERMLILKREDDPVDVREVVHGRWVVENEESIRCSECYFNRANIKMPMDYCPNCGAKMDGDGNG